MRLKLTREGTLLREAGFEFLPYYATDMIYSPTLCRLMDETATDHIPVEIQGHDFIFVLAEHDVSIPRAVVDHEEVFVHTVFACMAAIYAGNYDLLELLAIRSHLEP